MLEHSLHLFCHITSSILLGGLTWVLYAVSPKCAIGSKVQAEFGDWSVKYGSKVAKISGNIITVDWDDGGTTDREVTAKRVDDTEGKSCFVAGVRC